MNGINERVADKHERDGYPLLAAISRMTDTERKSALCYLSGAAPDKVEKAINSIATMRASRAQREAENAGS